MPLPISHCLIGASVAALICPRLSRARDWAMLALGAFFALSPDFDFFLVWVLRLGRHWHRSFTHSIFFALGVTVLALILTRFSRVRIVIACGLALATHGVFDYLAANEGGGVALLFPFSNRRMKLGYSSFFETGASSNYWYEVLKSCAIEAAVFMPVFLFALGIRHILYRERAEPLTITDVSENS